MARSEWERTQRRSERDQKAAEREERERYLASRVSKVDRANANLEASIASLTKILPDGLRRRPTLDFGKLRSGTPLQLGDLGVPLVPPAWDTFAPQEPGTFARMFFGTSRYEKRLQMARERFQAAMEQYTRAETDRQRRVVAVRRCHDHEQSVARERFAKLEQGWRPQAKGAVEEYLELVLREMRLPAGFPRDAQVAFDPLTSTAVVRLQLPRRDIIPKERGFQFVKTKDEIRRLPHPAREIANLYRSALSQVALPCIRDTFQADERLKIVGFNGHLRSTDLRTGQLIDACLISLSIERSQYEQLLLDRVDPEACLRHLNALVSPHPYDLEPITPVLDFDAKKYAFVEGIDVVSGLDARPVLTEMSPTEFEHLVRQLCEAMGMQSWTTRQSNDDGVDAVVFNPDAMVGGLSIVQAKRYTKVIGPAHIRELAGWCHGGKRAGRGILITTSWFTPGAEQKAREHNRMSLISGQNLVGLVKEYLGKDVLAGTVPPRRRDGDRTQDPSP